MLSKPYLPLQHLNVCLNQDLVLVDRVTEEMQEHLHEGLQYVIEQTLPRAELDVKNDNREVPLSHVPSEVVGLWFQRLTGSNR